VLESCPSLRVATGFGTLVGAPDTTVLAVCADGRALFTTVLAVCDDGPVGLILDTGPLLGGRLVRPVALLKPSITLSLASAPALLIELSLVTRVALLLGVGTLPPMGKLDAPNPDPRIGVGGILSPCVSRFFKNSAVSRKCWVLLSLPACAPTALGFGLPLGGLVGVFGLGVPLGGLVGVFGLGVPPLLSVLVCPSLRVAIGRAGIPVGALDTTVLGCLGISFVGAFEPTPR